MILDVKDMFHITSSGLLAHKGSSQTVLSKISTATLLVWFSTTWKTQKDTRHTHTGLNVLLVGWVSEFGVFMVP